MPQRTDCCRLSGQSLVSLLYTRGARADHSGTPYGWPDRRGLLLFKGLKRLLMLSGLGCMTTRDALFKLIQLFGGTERQNLVMDLEDILGIWIRKYIGAS